MQITLTHSFVVNHKMATKCFEACAEGPKSKWMLDLVADTAHVANSFRVHTTADVCAFIRRVWRRSGPSGNIAGTLFPAVGKPSALSDSSKRKPSLREIFSDRV